MEVNLKLTWYRVKEQEFDKQQLEHAKITQISILDL